MMEKPPQSPAYADLAGLFTWAWVIGLSLLGGLASFLRKVRAGQARAWNFVELIGELTASGLTGIITYNLCMWQNFPPQLTAALVGIASHMGSRALFKLEAVFDAKFPSPPQAGTDHEATRLP